MKPSSFRHGFLGIGRMAEAMLRAMLNAKALRPAQTTVSRQNTGELQRLRRELKVVATADNARLVRDSQVIWLGVKPYQAAEVMREIGPLLRNGAVLVSMMAGISTRFLQKAAGKKLAVVRLMPNTPAQLGAGMTGVFFGRGVRADFKKWLVKALETLGEVSLCKREDSLDAITGLSGSGVAFVYEFCRAMIEGGVASGLEAAEATRVALQTFRGAAEMLRQSGRNPQDLIAQVVSKGGTTEAGLNILKKRKTAQAIALAVLTATRRARGLRKENER